MRDFAARFVLSFGEIRIAAADGATGTVGESSAAVVLSVTPTAPGITTTTTSTTQPPVIVDATSEGSVSASSSFSGFSPSQSVDGSLGSSWFSAGSDVDGGSSTFRWSIAQDELIESVTIVGNGGHSNPSFQTGFGFGSVTVEVHDGAGNVVFSQSFGLGGTPDPTVTATPGVVGRDVVLIFSGHESPDCGGFAELSVVVAR